MGKLKVKKEVVEQLEGLIASGFGYDNKAHLLEEHMKVINSYGDELWDIDEYPLLNALSFSDMYNILHDNYEIEISAEDSIINRYNYEKKHYSTVKN